MSTLPMFDQLWKMLIVLMGIGYESGVNRAIEAARGAIESPLLELSINGAK